MYFISLPSSPPPSPSIDMRVAQIFLQDQVKAHKRMHAYTHTDKHLSSYSAAKSQFFSSVVKKKCLPVPEYFVS